MCIQNCLYDGSNNFLINYKTQPKSFIINVKNKKKLSKKYIIKSHNVMAVTNGEKYRNSVTNNKICVNPIFYVTTFFFIH